MKNLLKRIWITGFVLCIAAHIEAIAQLRQEIPVTGRISLDVKYMQAMGKDTLTLEVGHRYLEGLFITQSQVYQATKNDMGVFHFDVPVKYASGYFKLTTKKTYTDKGSETKDMLLVEPQYWERGDSIELRINHWERPGVNSYLCHFSGRGSEKYKVRDAIYQLKLIQQSILDIGPGNIFERTANEIHNKQVELLGKYKPKISTESYGVLKSDIDFDDTGFYFYPKERCRLLLREGKTDSATQFKATVIAGMKKDEDGKIGSSFSQNYLRFAYQKAKCLAFFKDTTDSPEGTFREIVAGYSGEVRDALFLYFFRTERLPANINKLYKTAERLATDSEAKIELSEYRKAIPGRTLGDYSFTDNKGKPVRLSDFDDKVVLLDFYFNGCGGCALYYREALSKVEHKFKGNPNVVFVSVSVDLTLKKWNEGLRSGLYNSPESTNLFTGGLGFRHPLIVDNNIAAYPTAILLSKGRKVISFNTVGLYNYDKLVKMISDLL